MSFPPFLFGNGRLARVKIGAEIWDNWPCVGLPVGVLSALGSKHIHFKHTEIRPMETTTDFSRIKDMYGKNRTNVRQVLPTEWAASGLKVPKDGKWQQYWTTHTDLVNWYGGEARLKRNYKTAEAAERRLWQVFDEMYSSIGEFFQQVYEPKPERVTGFCQQLYAGRRRRSTK